MCGVRTTPRSTSPTCTSSMLRSLLSSSSGPSSSYRASRQAAPSPSRIWRAAGTPTPTSLASAVSLPASLRTVSS